MLMIKNTGNQLPVKSEWSLTGTTLPVLDESKIVERVIEDMEQPPHPIRVVEEGDHLHRTNQARRPQQTKERGKESHVTLVTRKQLSIPRKFKEVKKGKKKGGKENAFFCYKCYTDKHTPLPFLTSNYGGLVLW